ncbi:MAG: DUF4276 family protein [bacterium]|nr:DUF4276 family protein [bacterium]
MNIIVLVEGQTEQAFKKILLDFLKTKLEDKMPKIKFCPYKGRVPKEGKLKRVVENYLAKNDAVIALTDVYTGTHDFIDAAGAKSKMKTWVGNNPKFYPHVACHDFEAWLIPYWEDIQKLAGHNKAKPGNNPEKINHKKPPAYHLKEIFEIGKCRDSYKKPRDGMRILKSKDLLVSANSYSELKEFLNTILKLSGLSGKKLIS